MFLIVIHANKLNSTNLFNSPTVRADIHAPSEWLRSNEVGSTFAKLALSAVLIAERRSRPFSAATALRVSPIFGGDGSGYS